MRGQQDDAIVLVFATAVSQTSVKNAVCVLGRLRGQRSAQRNREMEGEAGWSQTSRSDQRSYINARRHATGTVSEIWGKVWMPSASPTTVQSGHEPTRLRLVPKSEETTAWETLQEHQKRRRPDRNTRLAPNVGPL